MPDIEGILFDLDQTLLNRDKTLRLFLSWQWKQYKPLQVIPKCEFIKVFIELDKNGKVWKNEVYEKIIVKYMIRNTNTATMLSSYIDMYPRHAALFPYAKEVLQYFKNKGFKLGIITNGRNDVQSAVISTCGLKDIMDIILISETEGVKKPDPEIFRLATSRISLNSSSCAYIGDNPDADIKGAHNVGMHPIWKINSYYSPPRMLSKRYTFNDFRSLPYIIESNGWMDGWMD